MKKILAWALRVCCFAVIAAAAVTLIRCIIHVNDDHSRDALMSGAPQPAAAQTVMPSPAVTPETDAVDENPSVVLSVDGSATANHPAVTTTASFSNIVSGIRAHLSWYVNGELEKEQAECLLVEGSTVNFTTAVDINEESPEQADVMLQVAFQDKTVEAETFFLIEHPENSVKIQTEEITVTALRDSGVFTDSDLQEETGEMLEESDTGLLLAYAKDNTGRSALKLKLEDGEEGWVDSDDMEITGEDCTVDEDYTDDQKVEFVNSMKYDSQTAYLVWVSLYTQRVNIFKGYEGQWELEKSFRCSSGVNETPTTNGIYTIDTIQERWNLGKTYVGPVLIFNGGEAFTSRPFDTETNEIVDETMGKPASGGGVRMLEEDIEWMEENISVGTMVVVY